MTVQHIVRYENTVRRLCLLKLYLTMCGTISSCYLPNKLGIKGKTESSKDVLIFKIENWCKVLNTTARQLWQISRNGKKRFVILLYIGTCHWTMSCLFSIYCFEDITKLSKWNHVSEKTKNNLINRWYHLFKLMYTCDACIFFSNMWYHLFKSQDK